MYDSVYDFKYRFYNIATNASYIIYLKILNFTIFFFIAHTIILQNIEGNMRVDFNLGKLCFINEHIDSNT